MTGVLLRADAVLTAHDGELLHDAGVLIAAGRIVAVGPVAELARRAVRVIDAGGVLMPGMVDAHSHLRGMPLTAQGIDPAPLEAWICALSAMTALPTRDDVLVATGDLLQTGVTTVQGMLHTFADAAEYAQLCADAADGAVASGIRAVLITGFTDRAERAPEPAEGAWALPEPVTHALDVDDFVRLDVGAPHPRISWGTGPVAAQWAGDHALAAIRDAAGDRRIHTHLHESPLQRTWLRGLPAPIDRLDAAGLLGERTSAAHAVHLTDAELRRVRDSGAALVHCPVSNRDLRVGSARVARWRRLGIPAALGIDSQGDGAPDMFDVMREALHTASVLGEPLEPADVLAMATTGGAAAVGDPRLGRLVPGAPADIVGLNLPAAADLAAQIDTIVAHGSRADVRHVWVDGRAVVLEWLAVADVKGARARLTTELDRDTAARAARLRALRPIVDAVTALAAVDS
ncbi:amidohydrolase family protein [Microbacterium sp. SORGH_AS_0888]|uniref:amidohydrolase family protein n=1 Tax=Microbacterium sp. SORGH_AS_0888 TaxID=3041791 RepID=UPI0027828920|nr:amidohydrolase family protein [Microbacterium sp. SORGH_AS_0888]MDQ1130482.1 5-methylthioadenosine/S-adenosylhomocysteine deaminase [Microbacterium sp. SORGH_AS_0888]